MSEVGELSERLVRVLATEDPLNDLLDGWPGFAGRLPEMSAAEQASYAAEAAEVARLATNLEVSGAEAVTRDVVVQQATGVVTRVGSRTVEHTMLDLGSAPVVVALHRLPAATPAGPEAEDAYLERVAAVPAFLATAAERHRGGRAPVRRGVRAVLGLLAEYLASPELDPLRRPPLTGDRVDRRERLLAQEVRPAFARYRAVLDEELLPTARDEEHSGLCWLPGGGETYEALARMHTTTAHSPEELHHTGLRLLDELDEEFARLGGPLFGVRTGAEVRAALHRAPKLSSGEQLLRLSRAAMDRAEAAASRWFGRMPVGRCALREVPPEMAEHHSTASYLPAPLDGSRPGIYYANTYRVTERDLRVTEANAFHEAVPGHHFQIGLTGELELPLMHKVAWVNAFFEGWALYAERLADEMGLYSDDLMRLGMVANDAMRAARLVVDTGLHLHGWSRDRAVTFLRQRTAMTEVEIQFETDRYVEQPGQALSYMVGRLEVQRIRARAEAVLGAGFDIRAFHDVVLAQGALPLEVLDRVVDDWLSSSVPAGS